MSRPTSDEFDTILRRALDDVAGSVQPDAGMAERVLDGARPGRRTLPHPAGRTRSRRWALPLLAAASIVAIAVAAVVIAKPGHHTHHVPPVHPKPTAPALPHFRAADIYFSDTERGWALGDAQCRTTSKTSCPALLKTTDGGRHWQSLPTPKGLVSSFDSASCGTNGDLAGPCVDAVLFANATDGYLWSLHEVYWTTDGGQHWRRYVDPAHDWHGASQLVTVGGSVVRLAPVQECSSGCRSMVETAPVGTTDWQVSTPAGADVGLYSSGLATERSTVYLFAGGTADNAGRGVFRSSDGGRQWQQVAHHPCGVASGPEQDPFWGAGSIVADDGALIADCLSGIRVAQSGSGDFSGRRPLPASDNVYLQAAQNAQTIVAAASSSDPSDPRTTVYTTSDGGRHWQRTAGTLPVNAYDVHYRSTRIGYALPPDGRHYYRTDDGGTTWQLATFNA